MNSWLKTFIVSAVAVGAPIADAFLSQTPTGGFAAYLTAHPAVAAVAGVAAYALHNYLSTIAPPDPMKAKF